MLCMQIFPTCHDWDTHFYWWSATLFNNHLQFHAQSCGGSHVNLAVPYWPILVYGSSDVTAIVWDAHFEGNAPSIVILACGHKYTSIYHCLLFSPWHVIYADLLKCICRCRYWRVSTLDGIKERENRVEPGKLKELGLAARPRVLDLRVTYDHFEPWKNGQEGHLPCKASHICLSSSLFWIVETKLCTLTAWKWYSLFTVWKLQSGDGNQYVKLFVKMGFDNSQVRAFCQSTIHLFKIPSSNINDLDIWDGRIDRSR